MNIKETLSFIPKHQLPAILSGLRSEEAPIFIEVLNKLHSIIQNMPKTFETSEQGDQAIAYLHYFGRNYDFYITEKDSESEQLQAFGLVCCEQPEMGYISIVDLVISQHCELDLFWRPKTINEIKSRL